jgi:hypothetical protein
MPRTDTTWDPDSRMLRTHLTGAVGVDDVLQWRDGLHQQLRQVPGGGTFRLLLNLTGFEPLNLDAHKAMRTVVPELLASHGMRPAFIDLFEDGTEVPVTVQRQVRCTAFANVHHDPEKMGRYERLIGKPDQRFFTEWGTAEAWLLGVG